MNFIQFTGNKKTNEDFLKTIKSISSSHQSLLDNLKSLNIFESLNTEKNRISLNEAPNSFKMRISSKGTRSVHAHFPNIFGNGESFSLNFQNLKDFSFNLGKPFIFNNQIVQSKVTGIVDSKKINEKRVETKSIEVSSKLNDFSLKVGLDHIQKLNTFYYEVINKFLGVKFDTKIGLTKTDKLIPFCKFIASKKLSFVGDRFFFDCNLKIGRIFGQTTLFEKFFLGEPLKGYLKESIGPQSQNKKIGGNSFIEAKNRIGLFISKFEIFVFGDVSANSAKGVTECTQLLTDFGDNICIGKSVGFGCGMKNKKGPSFIFAVPLTTNPETEPYSFGIDFEF